jgi:hypothetical protein
MRKNKQSFLEIFPFPVGRGNVPMAAVYSASALFFICLRCPIASSQASPSSNSIPRGAGILRSLSSCAISRYGSFHIVSRMAAQYQIGVIYSKGHRVPRDDTEALKWFRLAADRGFAMAQYNVGYYYETGTVVTKNNAEVLKWYRLAAEQGQSRAQRKLGLMYANGNGVPRDYAEALKWFASQQTRVMRIHSTQLAVGTRAATACRVTMLRR